MLIQVKCVQLIIRIKEKQTDNELDHAKTDTSSDTTENQAENEREQYGAEHLKHSDTKPKINSCSILFK